jgi:hypothetical protein
VLLVGGALPVLPGSDVYQRLEAALREIERYESSTSGTGVSLGRTRRLTTAATEKTSFDMSQQLDALATEARLHGIAFYAVNPELRDRASKDVTSRHAGGIETQFSSANASVDGFVRLAAATGGYSHAGRNADVALSSVQSDLDSYYSLGYRSPLAVGPDTKIVVKPKNRDLRARAVIAAAKLMPEWQIADTVVNNHGHAPEQNDLGIVLVPNIANRSAETREVKLNVMIPFDRLRLVREGRDYNCSFTVFVSVGDATGGANPQRETRTFKWSEEMVNRLRGKNLAYGVDLTLGPGRDRVSVGIVDLVSGTTGYSRALLPSM